MSLFRWLCRTKISALVRGLGFVTRYDFTVRSC
jgi:hypothetical protein